MWPGDVAPRIREAVAALRRGEPFAGKAFDILAETDREIPGPGIHAAVGDSEKRRYLYPFNQAYSRRPLGSLMGEIFSGSPSGDSPQPSFGRSASKGNYNPK